MSSLARLVTGPLPFAASAVLASLLGGCELPPGAPATPQRPSFCFSPATTAAGTWELEAGAVAGPLDDYAELPATWKYGVDDRTEIALALSPLVSYGHASGPGDAGLAWRHRLADAEGGRPSLAVQASVKLPTADEDRGLGSGHTDLFGALTLGASTGRFGWVVFAQLGALGQAGEGADLERDLALMGTWTLDPTNALFAELSSRSVPEQGQHIGQLRLGHGITVRPDLVLDWSVWLPLSGDAPQTAIALGFTRNFGRHDLAHPAATSDTFLMPHGSE